MILDLSGPKVMGSMLSVIGGGYLVGTFIISAWGGPKRRILGILSVGLLQGIVMIGFGITPSMIFITASVFLFNLLDPIVGGSSQAFWQTKIPPDIQGRVFTVRYTISKIGLASALLLAGPLADRVFEPLLTATGPLANSIGLWVGVGAGRGTGFFFMILGLLFAGSSLAGLCYFPLRTADKTIPDSA